MGEFFVEMKFDKAENGFIILKSKLGTVKIPNNVPIVLFDEDIKIDFENGIIYDARVYSWENTILIRRSPKILFREQTDIAIWLSYLSDGRIFVKKEVLDE